MCSTFANSSGGLQIPLIFALLLVWGKPRRQKGLAPDWRWYSRPDLTSGGIRHEKVDECHGAAAVSEGLSWILRLVREISAAVRRLVPSC